MENTMMNTVYQSDTQTSFKATYVLGKTLLVKIKHLTHTYLQKV